EFLGREPAGARLGHLARVPDGQKAPRRQGRPRLPGARVPQAGAQLHVVRSIVGLIPLFAVEIIDDELLDAMPLFARRAWWLVTNRPHLAPLVSRWQEPGKGARHLLSLLRRSRLKALLRRMLDES
nr:hypothetical protein [Tanacetum cinerariifolium]